MKVEYTVHDAVDQNVEVEATHPDGSKFMTTAAGFVVQLIENGGHTIVTLKGSGIFGSQLRETFAGTEGRKVAGVFSLIEEATSNE